MHSFFSILFRCVTRLFLCFLFVFSALAVEPLQISGPEDKQEEPQILQYGPTTSTDTFWSIAQKLRPDSSVSIYQMMAAIYAANPQAFSSENYNSLEVGTILNVPSKEDVLAIPDALAKSQAERDDKNWRQQINQAQKDNLKRQYMAEAEAIKKQAQTETNKLTDTIDSLQENNLNIKDNLARALDQLLVTRNDNDNLQQEIEALNERVNLLEASLIQAKDLNLRLDQQIKEMQITTAQAVVEKVQPKSIIPQPLLVGGLATGLTSAVLIILWLAFKLKSRASTTIAAAETEQQLADSIATEKTNNEENAKSNTELSDTDANQADGQALEDDLNIDDSSFDDMDEDNQDEVAQELDIINEDDSEDANGIEQVKGKIDESDLSAPDLDDYQSQPDIDENESAENRIDEPSQGVTNEKNELQQELETAAEQKEIKEQESTNKRAELESALDSFTDNNETESVITNPLDINDEDFEENALEDKSNKLLAVEKNHSSGESYTETLDDDNIEIWETPTPRDSPLTESTLNPEHTSQEASSSGQEAVLQKDTEETASKEAKSQAKSRVEQPIESPEELTQQETQLSNDKELDLPPVHEMDDNIEIFDQPNLQVNDREPQNVDIEDRAQTEYIEIDNLIEQADEPDVNTEHNASSSELDDLKQIAGDEAALVDVDNDENLLNARLDLARAYMEIGELDSAKALIDEVLHDGSDAQKQEAKQLQQSMNSI